MSQDPLSGPSAIRILVQELVRCLVQVFVCYLIQGFFPSKDSASESYVNPEMNPDDSDGTFSEMDEMIIVVVADYIESLKYSEIESAREWERLALVVHSSVDELNDKYQKFLADDAALFKKAHEKADKHGGILQAYSVIRKEIMKFEKMREEPGPLKELRDLYDAWLDQVEKEIDAIERAEKEGRVEEAEKRTAELKQENSTGWTKEWTEGKDKERAVGSR